MAIIYWPSPDSKGTTFKLCVLIRLDFKFCVLSSPLRGARRENAPLTDVRSSKRVAAPTSLERFSSCCVRSTWPLRWARVHRKEMILNYRMERWSKEWRVSYARADWLIAVRYLNLGDTLIDKKSLRDRHCNVAHQSTYLNLVEKQPVVENLRNILIKFS